MQNGDGLSSLLSLFITYSMLWICILYIYYGYKLSTDYQTCAMAIDTANEITIYIGKLMATLQTTVFSLYFFLIFWLFFTVKKKINRYRFEPLNANHPLNR